MSRDGQETPSIAERLKARSEVEFREVEELTRTALQTHAESLQASSTAALKQTEDSISVRMTEIEARIRDSKDRMLGALTEIEIRPRRTMRNVMITSAVIGGIVATIPWAAMSWLGISVTGTAGTWLEQRTEIRAQETRINALGEIVLMEIDGQTVLMLPATTTQIYQCGETRTPCVRIGE